ncbi:Xaa-Pro dipeptidyl-peptidase [Nocardiopsis aegyptia]|uniref:Xaa-Pro dipeptidyl-peptidase n=1 Tax=Nocardiopsis aegyptia TaxID=220378 RepID=UPI0036723AE6
MPPSPGRARFLLTRAGAVTTAALTAATVLTAPAAAEPPSLEIVDGRTQVAFEFADAIYQEVDIRTEADSDGDGELDTVRMRILRPKESDAGLDVATIIEPSPYWAGGNPVTNHDVDLDTDEAGTVPRGGRRGGPRADETALGAALDPAGTGDPEAAAERSGPNTSFSGYYDNYFLPRGYAVAQVDSLGSGDSTGCPTSGAHNESLGAKAAVEWLTGDAVGWDADGEEVTADWSNGAAAMTGISYNGTLPTAAATTGVEGLKTIVPQAAISSWYGYYREGGAVRAPGGYQGEDADVLAEYVYTRDDGGICRPVIDGLTEEQDRVSGDYTEFWDERNYLTDADEIRASVFLVHGLNDRNVMPGQAADLWAALEENDVPRKLWLHQGAHINQLYLRTDPWLDQLHGWFDHWLYEIDNGITDEPAVDVEGTDGTWTSQADWPGEGTAPVKLHLNTDPDAATGGLAPRPRPVRDGTESFTDQGRTLSPDDLLGDPDSPGTSSLVYVTGELTEDVRLSGSARISIRAAMDGPSPFLTAALVDLGTAERPTGRLRYDFDDMNCYGESVPGDTGCIPTGHHVTEEADHRIVARGWLDARNRTSLERQRPVVAGQYYRYRWDLQPGDHVFPAGHRIGVMLLSTDHDHTLRYPAGTEVGVDTNAAHVTLPVAEGHDALR